jgi:molybdenum cofactor biosynthesis protein B
MSAQTEFVPLNIAVLTVSDTRTYENDTSGDCLIELLQAAGHHLQDRNLIPDDIYQMRAVVSQWIANEAIHAVIITGGTGFTDRDSTPEALTPLFDKQVEGFGELFRQVSYEEIGSSTIQSRAVAGLANHTVIFCLPGSTGACRTGWTKIIEEQLDSRHRPCNFVGLLIKKGQNHRPTDNNIKPYCGPRS